MSRFFFLLGLTLVLFGAFVAWPLIYASMHYQVVNGRILEVFADHRSEDQVHVSVAYEFPIPSDLGTASAIGHGLADRSLQRLDGILVPLRQEREITDRLLHAAPVRRVFYEVNDPIGTAFMLTDQGNGRGIGPDQGLIAIGAGLMLWFLAMYVKRKKTL